MPGALDPLLDAELSRRNLAHQLRQRQVVTSIDAVHVEIDGKSFVNFCSNNYLGLTHHPQVIRALHDAAATHGAGSGASGLISGFSPPIAKAEAAIAAWKGTQSAILLSSGYQANHAAVQTLAAIGATHPDGIRFLIDKLAHASLLDAIRGSGAKWRIFPHNGMSKLKRLLSEAPPGQIKVVVSESIFSMDGDAADLQYLSEIKRKTPFILLLDEAHGSGVYGKNGSGLACEQAVQDIVDISVVTLSKAAGCVGGAICASDQFCQSVLNLGRAYIFSTSIPPAVAAAIEAAIGVMRDEPDRQRRVRALSADVRNRLQSAGYTIPLGDSPIIPVMAGEEEKAISLAAKLAQEGLLIQAVRPPTVPRGTSRLRVTLSCEHSDGEIDHLIDALTRLK